MHVFMEDLKSSLTLCVCVCVLCTTLIIIVTDSFIIDFVFGDVNAKHYFIAKISSHKFPQQWREKNCTQRMKWKRKRR